MCMWMQVSRGDIVVMIVQTFKDMNSAFNNPASKQHNGVQKVYELCGQAPRGVSEMKEFNKHLDALSTNAVYSMLERNVLPVDLSDNAVNTEAAAEPQQSSSSNMVTGIPEEIVDNVMEQLAAADSDDDSNDDMDMNESTGGGHNNVRRRRVSLDETSVLEALDDDAALTVQPDIDPEGDYEWFPSASQQSRT
eukprot:GHVU01143560.1.p1 GENE.GHVU01143560.1~~GHVU01143560.1.p1  ORF type:complete len:193 (-),score=44.96 GHVU01143560.1:451-1029(-)